MKEYSFTEVIEDANNMAMANLHTSTIAKITKVNEKTINAKPVFNRVVDGESVELPEFAEIPVFWLSGGGSSIRHPLAVGDYALLIFIERCIDDWVFGKDYSDPREPRMHDYSDAVALVGLFNNSGMMVIPDTTTFDGDIIHNGAYKNDSHVDTPLYKTNGESGTTGTFSTADIKTIVVKNGIITSIS